ncbi:MAG: class I SAM-dependent methyltransferase [Clostridiales bacterium]|nr:class I SAM-dependent methyltransferase [Clostridiales bacterium]
MKNGTGFFQSGWDENDSKNFIDYGLFFVPERERQHKIICSAIPESTGSTKIVDICCGDGLLGREILRRFPHHQLYLFDGSMTMLEKAKENLGEYIDRVEFTRFDLAKDDWRHFS